ncbi:MAG: alpha/beta hydrolase [Acidobacteria bacterium]|nr:alpha/beta hydrolase [Acidobacteriota bacterium]
MKIVKMIPPASLMEMPMMDTSAITRKWLDVGYTPAAPHPARKLDIYLPEEGDGPFRTLICIHGGAFTGGSKDDFQVSGFVDGVAYGFAVVSVEQRLCSPLPDGGYSSEGLFPNPLHDFKAAIRFLRANAAQYKLDPGRFAAAGDSAGGWHAIMAVATAGVPAMYDESLGWAAVDGRVRAVVDWFGCGDLLIESEFNASFETMVLPNGLEVPRVIFEDVFLGVKCVDHPGLARLASPETWITGDMPPVLLQHGAADEIVTAECSRRIAGRIEQVCGRKRVDYDEFPGYIHGDERFYDDDNLARVFAWLKEKLE